MKNKVVTLLFIVLSGYISSFAATKYFFYVQLANKSNSPYSISNPTEYLSARAIQRRANFNISIDSTDLPVNPAYITQIANLNVPVFNSSKWLNGLTVLVADSSIMSQVRILPFVRWAKYTGKSETAATLTRRKSKFETQDVDYGTTATQLNQVNAGYLHNLGYTGKGVHVAVLDAGFLNANTNVGFDSLRLQGRLLGTKDFTEKTPNIYGSDSHGSNVLSIMAGNKPGQYLGAAPHASYWLIRTEYAPTEYLCETDFWVSGIEFADSVGVDVVNSSLGYTTFEDPVLDFTYANMNGTVSRASRAATIASQKGIIICNSAGNEGNKSWHYISSPADAAGIVSVGAVTATGESSLFSSFGPTADRRLKPDISAMGTGTSYINTSGSITSGSGTSYASPIMTGMFSCFLQYAKEKISSYTVTSLIDAVKRSAHLYPFPTAQMGYGIPDLQEASNYFASAIIKPFNEKVKISTTNSQIRIDFNSNQLHDIYIYNTSGQLVYTNSAVKNNLIISTQYLKTGIFFMKINNNSETETFKIQLKH